MQSVEPTRLAVAAWEMASQTDMAETVGVVLRAARDLTAATEVGVMRLGSGQTVEIAGTSTSAVQRADELQLRFGEGPCLTASRSGELCLVGDTRTDVRWPTWGPAAAGLGWNSILSLPLVAAGRGLGALNLYAAEQDSFRRVEVEIAQIFARYAAMALARRAHEEDLRETVERRHVIGQAQGVLMERYDLSADRALVALHRHADKHGADVYAVAQHVIGVRRLPEQPLHDRSTVSAAS
ncbi:MAG: GAF and ANTAR domain-containing protein [Propionibacteriaceae bacterium]